MRSIQLWGGRSSFLTPFLSSSGWCRLALYFSSLFEEVGAGFRLALSWCGYYYRFPNSKSPGPIEKERRREKKKARKTDCFQTSPQENKSQSRSFGAGNRCGASAEEKGGETGAVTSRSVIRGDDISTAEPPTSPVVFFPFVRPPGL